MATRDTLPSPSDLLTHREPMLLVDQIVTYDNDSITASFTPITNTWYADENGNMPAWIGIELMAQAIGCHVSLLKRVFHLPPKQGVLLGTRKYQANQAIFNANALLVITARVLFQDESGLGAYDCSIHHNQKTLATATLKVFEPENFQQFLNEAMNVQ